MSAYKINVKIEMTKCVTKDIADEPFKSRDGSQSMIIDESKAANIDKCENSVLRVANPAIRDALATHLAEVSENAAIEQDIPGEVKINKTPYRIDGEAGRMTFPTHSIIADGKVVFNTAVDIFTPLTGKGYHRTSGFKEIAMIYGDTEQSFRKTGEQINRIRYQEEGGTPYRTLQHNTEKEGAEQTDFIEVRTARILEENGFAEDGAYRRDNAEYAENEPVTVSESMVFKAAE